jgi:hypothetical protein
VEVEADTELGRSSEAMYGRNIVFKLLRGRLGRFNSIEFGG